MENSFENKKCTYMVNCSCQGLKLINYVNCSIHSSCLHCVKILSDNLITLHVRYIRNLKGELLCNGENHM